MFNPMNGLKRPRQCSKQSVDFVRNFSAVLSAKGSFARVVQTGEAAQYDVQVRLLAAAEVSQSARILFGVLAGANELAVRVEGFNTANHALLVSFTAMGKSASHPLSSENDMDAAIREAVDEIIKGLES
jgi:hypothetical protein